MKKMSYPTAPGMGNLKGPGLEQIPEPTRRPKLPAGKIRGTGPRGAMSHGSPLTASYDSRPLPGDNRPGATRPGPAKNPKLPSDAMGPRNPRKKSGL